MKKLEDKSLALGKAVSMGEAILAICHPDSITTVKHWNTIIKARFEEVRVISLYIATSHTPIHKHEVFMACTYNTDVDNNQLHKHVLYVNMFLYISLFNNK